MSLEVLLMSFEFFNCFIPLEAIWWLNFIKFWSRKYSNQSTKNKKHIYIQNPKVFRRSRKSFLNVDNEKIHFNWALDSFLKSSSFSFLRQPLSFNIDLTKLTFSCIENILRHVLICLCSSVSINVLCTGYVFYSES